jgi:hypothetical protein
MADFVFSSALGMTAGPAIAASLSIVAPPNQSEANSYWTIETAPGKFTAVFTQTNSICFPTISHTHHCQIGKAMLCLFCGPFTSAVT